ncbi:hypothetical protein GCM10023317_23140 [Actinopolymorpha pittospori]|uniref:HEPN domain-containing protein n=1 Tax=Actinopolymorpha pittospori TaxID=648752 RepID=A0A927MQU9_9ACTN|nr:hypothetical protein [Actinopolymorpha pittospori]
MRGNEARLAYVLAYDAARKALTAVLENQGLRPTSRGGHVALIDAVRASWGPTAWECPAARGPHASRNRVEHPDSSVPPVSPQEVTETLPKVEDVLDAAAKVIEAMPVWT